MEALNTLPRVDADVAESIEDLMRRSRAAQTDYAGMGQAAMDDAVAAVGWAIMEPSRNRQLAELAVRDTGLGNVEDKILKNHRKTLGLLRDLQGVGTTGVISENPLRSEEHTSELQSLMRISYAVFCLKKKNTKQLQ